MNDKDALKNEASKTDKRKQSLYFPESMLQEIKDEAARLDRSLSWVVQQAWKIARERIKAFFGSLHLMRGAQRNPRLCIMSRRILSPRFRKLATD